MSLIGSLSFFNVLLNELPSTTRNILEVGCGEGAMSHEFAKRGFNVVAIDVDAEIIATAREQFGFMPNLDFRVVAAEDFSREHSRDRFDFIFSTFAAHHFIDVKETLALLSCNLKESGKIVILDFFAEPRNSFFDYFCDQLLWLHFRHYREVITTLRSMGILKIFRFVIWRFLYAISKRGFSHIREDYSNRRIPSLSEWARVLPEGGQQEILLGAVFLYKNRRINSHGQA